MKYHNKLTTIDNITFHSISEANRYQELKLLEKAGEILELSLQPSFTLQEAFVDRKGTKHRSIVYKADFKYWDRQFKCVVVEDVKGYATAEFKLKKKLFLKKYPEYIFLVTS